MAFLVQFLECWRLICIDRKIWCHDTSENIYQTTLKFSFRHWPFYVLNIRYYFGSIGGAIANILAKKFISRLLDQVYLIRRSIFRTLHVILRRLEVQLRTYVQKHLFVSFEIGFTLFAVLYLEYWRLVCSDWMYGCEDMRENDCLPGKKLGLRHLPF